MSGERERPWETSNMSLPEAAIAYSGCYKIFPVYGVMDGVCLCGRSDCRNPGKHPMTKRGHLDATKDVGQIATWWKENPEANAGIALEASSVVVDFDEGDALETLAEMGLALPKTRMASTGRGLHVYFTTKRPLRPATDIFKGHPSGVQLKADLRGEGSYVVAPPSRHVSGVQYRWLNSLPPADAPQWLYELASRSRSKKSQAHDALKGFPEGTRNDQIFRKACRFRRLGLSMQETRILIHKIAAACNPPFPDIETDRCIESAYKNVETTARPAETDGEPGDVYVSLANLAEDPKIFDPPRPVVPRIAWAGRVTMLAAREKYGKSTLAGAAAAKVTSGGDFLEGPCAEGAVLWTALEEHPGEVAQRFEGFGGNRDRVFVATGLPYKLEDIEAAARRCQPQLIVIDTLAQLADSIIKDSASSTDWTPLMRGLCDIARESDAAVLLLHHARKSDGKYRDSTAIGAGADVIIEMMPVEGRPTHRRLSIKARFDVPETLLQFSQHEYKLAEGQRSLSRRITDFVHENPGTTKSQIAKGVSGRRSQTLAEIDELLATGTLIDRGMESASCLHVKRPRRKEAMD